MINFTPFGKTLSLTLNGNQHISSCISHLNGARSPRDIERPTMTDTFLTLPTTIVSCIVYAFKRQSCRSCAKITIPILELSPACAYTNPTSTIIVKTLAIRIGAAITHPRPNTIFWEIGYPIWSAFARLPLRLRTYFTPVNLTASEPRRRHNTFFTAHTTAFPFSPVTMSAYGHQLNDGQLSKYLAHQIFQLTERALRFCSCTSTAGCVAIPQVGTLHFSCVSTGTSTIPEGFWATSTRQFQSRKSKNRQFPKCLAGDIDDLRRRQVRNRLLHSRTLLTGLKILTVGARPVPVRTESSGCSSLDRDSYYAISN